MMFLKLLLVGAMLLGCGKLWDDENEGHTPLPQSSAPPTVEKIFVNEKLGPGRDWLTNKGGPGDKLAITLSGTERPFKFREEVWAYDSYYGRLLSDNCFPYTCESAPSFPDCSFRHQSVVIGEERPFLFPEALSKWPLKIEVNGEFYPLGEVVEHKGTEVTFEFEIREEMLDENLGHTGIYLAQIGPRDDETIRAGFLGFVDPEVCPEIENDGPIFKLEPYYAAPVMGYTATLVIEKGGS